MSYKKHRYTKTRQTGTTKKRDLLDNAYKIEFSLDKPSKLNMFKDLVLRAEKKGYKRINLFISDDKPAFPNVCAPVAGLIDYFKNKGFEFFVDFHFGYFQKLSRIFDPLDVEDSVSNLSLPFNIVWSFSSPEGIRKLVNAYVKALRESDLISQEGIVQSLEWCLNETLENVLLHSKEKRGFVMAQLMRKQKLFSFCVFDYGIGIYNSFKGTIHEPKDPYDAIKLAMSQQVTSNSKDCQGNGLWGLSQIIKESRGHFGISSNGVRYRYEYGDEYYSNKDELFIDGNRGTTIIDAQLDYSKPIDFTRVMDEDRPDFWLEKHENDLGQFVLSVKEDSNGTGTRSAGEKMRTLIKNTFAAGYSKILIDFDGVELISSSYADELFGKLVNEIGLCNFNEHIGIIRLNKINESIVNRSVGQRMAWKYLNYNLVEEDYALSGFPLLVTKEH